MGGTLLAFPERLDDSQGVLLQFLAKGTGEGGLQDYDGVPGVDKHKVVGELDELALVVGFERDDPEEGRLAVEIVLLVGLDLGAELEAGFLEGFDSLLKRALEVGTVIFFDWEMVYGEGTLSTGSAAVEDRSVFWAAAPFLAGGKIEGEALLGEGDPLGG